MNLNNKTHLNRDPSKFCIVRYLVCVVSHERNESFVEFGRALERLGDFLSVWENFEAFGKVLESFVALGAFEALGCFEAFGEIQSVWKSFGTFGRFL